MSKLAELEVHDVVSWKKGAALGGSGFGRTGPEPVSCWLPVYQQPQQQPAAQSYGGYKEPAAPASIQRSAPGGGGKRYRAVYDYSAADEDEVSFQDGDTIVNVQQIDDGWMYGTVERTGDTGMLPANYVEAI